MADSRLQTTDSRQQTTDSRLQTRDQRRQTADSRLQTGDLRQWGTREMRDYQNIKAYEFADKLVLLVYKLTKEFPKEELYGLTSQIRRSVVSVAANIVEGASRQHKKDYLNFLYIARGSLAETKYMIHLSKELNYLGEGEYEKVEELRNETAKVLHGLIGAVSSEVKK